MIVSLQTYTLAHVALSLVGIASGLGVLAGMLAGRRLDGTTALFLAATVLTSATGFGFPFHKLLPSHIVGILSLVVLAVAIYARYARALAGRWRAAYVVGASLALYLNVFVLIVQGFLKVPSLNRLAPTQTEPPFVVVQAVALGLFGALTFLAEKRFRPTAAASSSSPRR